MKLSKNEAKTQKIYMQKIYNRTHQTRSKSH